MQAGPVAKLAAILTDGGQQVPGVAPGSRGGPGTADAAPSDGTPSRRAVSSLRVDMAGRHPRRQETSRTPETPTRRADKRTPRASRRRIVADRNAKARTHAPTDLPASPVARAGNWTRVIQAALQKAQTPARRGPAATPRRVAVSDADGVSRSRQGDPSLGKAVSKLTLSAAATAGSARLAGAPNKAGEPGPKAGRVARHTAGDGAQAKGGKAPDGTGSRVPSPTAQAKGTQTAGQGVPDAARPVLPTRPTPQAAAALEPVLRTLRAAGGPGESAGLKKEGEVPPQGGQVSPIAGRAAAVFREAKTAQTRETRTSPDKAPTASRAFTVGRIGGEAVVSGGRGQAPAAALPDVDVLGAAAQRTGAEQGRAGPGPMRQGPVAGGVADQVAESIRASGAPTGRQIVVQLHPPDLGRVRIIFRSEGDAVRGIVRVDNPETLSRLEREAAPLIQRLQSSGIEVRRLDVTLSDSQNGATAQNPAFREGQNRQDGWVGDPHAGAPAGDTPGDAGQAAGEPEAAGGRVVGGGAINVRI